MAAMEELNHKMDTTVSGSSHKVLGDSTKRQEAPSQAFSYDGDRYFQMDIPCRHKDDASWIILPYLLI